MPFSKSMIAVVDVLECTETLAQASPPVGTLQSVCPDDVVQIFSDASLPKQHYRRFCSSYSRRTRLYSETTDSCT